MPTHGLRLKPALPRRASAAQVITNPSTRKVLQMNFPAIIAILVHRQALGAVVNFCPLLISHQKSVFSWEDIAVMETGKVHVTIICSCCLKKLKPDASIEFEFTGIFIFASRHHSGFSFLHFGNF
jgi:hypothetical protein